MKSSPHDKRSIRLGASLILLGTILCLGCGISKDTAADANVGTVQLALTLPDGSSVTNVAWKVLSSMDAVVASGTLNTMGTRTPSFISSLPAAAGDTVNMTATTSGGIACAGTSAAFDVIAGRSVNVTVNLVCGNIAAADGGTLGSVVVTGSLVPGDHCPALTAWFITPQSTTGANPIDVSVTATDADMGETLKYAWKAAGGSFTGANSATTQYTCAGTGPQTLTVDITDDHAPAPCTTEVMFPAVSCN